MTETPFTGFTFINNHLTCFFFLFCIWNIGKPLPFFIDCLSGEVFPAYYKTERHFPARQGIGTILSVSTLGKNLILILQYLCRYQDLNSKTSCKRTRKPCRICLSEFWTRQKKKKKVTFFVCNLGFVLFSSNQMLYFERLFSFLATMTMKTMACLNVIKWRILSLLWAPLDVVRLPEEWSLMKKTVVYNTGKVYCWITYLS